jgi:hypothetical protein
VKAPHCNHVLTLSPFLTIVLVRFLQVATNEQVVYVLGKHVQRLSKGMFTSYERAMYRSRAVRKWTPNVSYAQIWPGLAGWVLYDAWR